MKFLSGRLGLRARIYGIIFSLVMISLTGGATMIWYTFQMDELMQNVIETDVLAQEMAGELEIALVKQKGFVSYYFITGDQRWLALLDERRGEFSKLLSESLAKAESDEERETLNQIESEYENYVASKDEVIELYKEGKREIGAMQHERVREHFFRVLDLTDKFRDLHKKKIRTSLEEAHSRAVGYRGLAMGLMGFSLVLAGVLAFVLIVQILEPIRRLALDGGSPPVKKDTGDDIRAISSRVHDLIEDVDLKRVELEKSREKLMESEKMVVVGKLAADVAHSIRNPMTSIKMRLFSLERGLELTRNQREDFEVVSEEMRRLDNIVRNFLEFSRPPKLETRVINAADSVNETLELLQHQIESRRVKVLKPQRAGLPSIQADPELLKEVLVNLVVNALAAMEEGGTLTVSTEEGVAESVGQAVIIKISDTGPGIPERLLDKILEPFFSTKEDGTGLGLSIASRIIGEHGGSMDIRSQEGQGTTIIVSLPIMDA